jgi:hypothetical protein
LLAAENAIISGGLGYNTIVIITEGGDTCGGDLPAAINKCISDGFEIRIVGIADTTQVSHLNSLAQLTGHPLVLMDGSADIDQVFSDIDEEYNGEKCDGIDNDCDGTTDEDLVRDCAAQCGGGVQFCKNGEWGGCIDPAQVPEGTVPDVPKELCDGIDNDCNGQTDEIFSLGGLCFKSIGVCSNSGKFVCKADKTGTECDAPAPSFSAEICDNIDNDCDGQTDEGLSQSCSSECGTGQMVCSKGIWGSCTITQYNPEICDGKDNDCDGITDEGYDVGEACGSCGQVGIMKCTADKLSTYCYGVSQIASPEICNGKDDDCDGKIDEGDLCPEDQICFKGQCIYD